MASPGKVIPLSNNVFVTPHGYNNCCYGHITRKLCPYIVDTFSIISEILDFKSQHLIIKPLRGKYMGMVLPQIGSPILINPKRTTISGTLLTVCHESIHADQLHKGNLKLSSVGMMEWKGQLIKYDYNLLSSNKVLYDQLPWENDANERQQDLYNTILKKVKIKEDVLI